MVFSRGFVCLPEKSAASELTRDREDGDRRGWSAEKQGALGKRRGVRAQLDRDHMCTSGGEGWAGLPQRLIWKRCVRKYG